LEEAEVSFTVAPWARNGHKVGGEFLFKVAELLMVGFSRDAWARMDSAETISDMVKI
jgi:hypothetical protein